MIGDRPMTNAELIRRHRARLAEEKRRIHDAEMAEPIVSLYRAMDHILSRSREISTREAARLLVLHVTVDTEDIRGLALWLAALAAELERAEA